MTCTLLASELANSDRDGFYVLLFRFRNALEHAKLLDRPLWPLEIPTSASIGRLSPGEE